MPLSFDPTEDREYTEDQARELWTEARRMAEAGDCDFRGWRFPKDPDATWDNEDRCFRNVIFKENADFHHASFSEYAEFRGASFSKKADFSNVNFSDYTSFREVTFNGDVLLIANFDGDADFGNAIFDGNACFYHSCFSKNVDFRDAYFSKDAEFHDVNFRGDDSFNGYANLFTAHFNGNADFRKARFSEHTSFRDACFSGDADFRDASFRGYTDFRFRDVKTTIFSGCHLQYINLKEANFSNADLREVFQPQWENKTRQGKERHKWSPLRLLDHLPDCLTRIIMRGRPFQFILDDTQIRNARFSSTSADPWTTLRRNYSGPMFAIHLLLLIAFLFPLVSKAAFWVTVGRTEETLKQNEKVQKFLKQMGPIQSEAEKAVKQNEKAQKFLEQIKSILKKMEKPVNQNKKTEKLFAKAQELLVKAQGFLEKAKSIEEKGAEIAGKATGKSLQWEETRVGWILVGWHSGMLLFVLALCGIVYNALRFWLTYKVGLLRDREQQSGRSPGKNEYLRLFNLHIVASYLACPLLFFFAITLWNLVTQPVYILAAG